MSTQPEPLVSVVLPTYNRLRTLPRAVNSVLQQSYRNLELLVVDDASTDGTAAWLETLPDPRVCLLRQVPKGGAAAARNRGIRAARGELIAFQDSDDEWLLTKLELQVARLMSAPREVGWVGGSYVVVDGSSSLYVRSAALERGSGYEDSLFEGLPFVTPTWLVRRSCLEHVGLFDESMACLEDWDLIFRLEKHCQFLAVPDFILVRYGSADSVFADVPKRLAGLETMLARHEARWLAHRRWASHYLAELGRLHAIHGAPAEGSKYLIQAFCRDPLRLRTMVLFARVVRQSIRSRLRIPGS